MSMRSYLLIAACCGLPSLVAASEPRTLSIPVLTLSGANQRDGADEASSMVMEVNDRPAPESHGGIPPQYKTDKPDKTAGDLDAASQDAADDPTVRFLVPLIQRPVLVEATILIDDQPFGKKREERVRELLARLEAVEDPDPSETTPIDPEFEGTVAGPSVDASLASRLRRYSEATQRIPGHEEVRWFLNHWVGGPPLLLLNESFQAARAHQSPLFQILDRDEDGVISAAELAAAEQTLLGYDLNQDEVLSFDEIVSAAKRTSSGEQTVRFDPPPLILLPALREPATMRRLAQYYDAASDNAWELRRFGPDGDGRVSGAERDQLQADAPEIRIEVRFDTRDMTASRLIVTVPEALESEGDSLEHAGAITIEIAGSRLEISAVQSALGLGSDQISIGAVRDGYPLLPLVDRDEDGRLSVRELRELADRLATLDCNDDGQIEQAELRPTLRVAIGHGPVIHAYLAAVRRVYPVPTSAPPEWFVRMDRNRDGDLTPREFLGSQEQFDALDTDGDGLISVAEALASEL
jgi:Ca2+-binding EF-hand superfamily protein